MGSVFTCKLNPCCGDRRNCTPPRQYHGEPDEEETVKPAKASRTPNEKPASPTQGEALVSIIARTIRQSLKDYGHQSADSSLPEYIAADVAYALSAPTQGELAVKALIDALKPFASIADMEPNTPEAASTFVNISRCRDARAALDAYAASALDRTTLPPTEEGMVMVPKAEFDALYREADSLARCNDYDMRLGFMMAKHRFDQAMAGKKTAAAAPQGTRA